MIITSVKFLSKDSREKRKATNATNENNGSVSDIRHSSQINDLVSDFSELKVN